MKKEKLYSIFTYVAGSVIFLSIPIFSSLSFNSEDMWSIPRFQRNFLSYVLLLLFFFLNYFVLTPRFYFKKEYFAFFLLLAGFYLFIELAPGYIIHDNYTAEYNGHHGSWHRGSWYYGSWSYGSRHWLLFKLSQHFFLFFTIVIFSLMMSIRNKWKQTQREKLNAELAYLKAQINPHFLFNTLNSIYSLAIEKSDYTATAVVKLSGMMRYVLNEASHEFVSLEKEINYINDYIELQNLRLGNTVQLDYRVNGKISGKRIAPLVLMPFIENAFKYGVNPEEPSPLSIVIDVDEEQLNLDVINNKVRTSTDHQSRSGLGLENTKNRLQLLYPSLHTLNVHDTGKEFHVSLTIRL